MCEEKGSEVWQGMVREREVSAVCVRVCPGQLCGVKIQCNLGGNYPLVSLRLRG